MATVPKRLFLSKELPKTLNFQIEGLSLPNQKCRRSPGRIGLAIPKTILKSTTIQPGDKLTVVVGEDQVDVAKLIGQVQSVTFKTKLYNCCDGAKFLIPFDISKELGSINRLSLKGIVEGKETPLTLYKSKGLGQTYGRIKKLEALRLNLKTASILVSLHLDRGEILINYQEMG